MDPSWDIKKYLELFDDPAVLHGVWKGRSSTTHIGRIQISCFRRLVGLEVRSKGTTKGQDKGARGVLMGYNCMFFLGEKLVKQQKRYKKKGRAVEIQNLFLL